MKLIDKDAVVAEIMSRIDDIKVSQKAGLIKKREAETKIILFKSILSLLDTIDVKEVQEKPVSEELEDVSMEWLRPQLDKSYSSYGETKMMELTRFDGYAMLDAIEFGVQWKKEQFEKNRLKHCNSITNEQAELEQGFIDQHLDKHQRIPTFLDAIEYGMNIQKEQMMKNAVDATVHIDAGGYPYIPQIELYDYDKDVPLAKEGDKYKVVLIKED